MDVTSHRWMIILQDFEFLEDDNVAAHLHGYVLVSLKRRLLSIETISYNQMYELPSTRQPFYHPLMLSHVLYDFLEDYQLKVLICSLFFINLHVKKKGLRVKTKVLG